MRHGRIEIESPLAVDSQPLELGVIIPTYNERVNVEILIARLSIVLAGISWEAIFVDDNSPDGTSALVRDIARQNRNIRIVHRIGRRGLSTAVVEGMLASSAPVLAVIDGDMQHDEAILPRLFSKVFLGEADIAVGTRYSEGGGTGDWSSGRLRMSQWATKISKFTLRADLTDPMSGFFVISRSVLMDAVPKLSGVGFKILLDIVASLQTKPTIAEIPYVFRSRAMGESKAGALVAVEYLALLADKTVGRFLPVRLLSFLAVGSIGVGIHLTALASALAMGYTFLSAEIIATMTAMTANFTLNNIFTYHDRRLRGWKIFPGLLSYYAICGVGGVANIGIGTWLNGQNSNWWVAGLAGVIVGAVWNFAASSFVTWRK
ncbi:dolichol-phosphate mannosyltransferase [Sphingorhabdus rigui]|uniref:Dolichol-phosphate mannosyltransferase n=1 Tax=Sphingorhabdus rigui TaxID=1282858 RepID=A0A840B2G2_9SPHN|nr:glycosyltransferase family 2 protein [Sphingorhabdus rigui]MBB3943386.1 dolichol-phosphate mannosyltransferase [Sphingorhabdus rigui]